MKSGGGIENASRRTDIQSVSFSAWLCELRGTCMRSTRSVTHRVLLRASW
jgi:hypothetical protein